MARARTDGNSGPNCCCYYNSLCRLLLLMLTMMMFSANSCYGFGTFGFDIHHRYSDPVKGILAVDDLPPKGSLRYYGLMAHRDHVIHGRRLAAADGSTPVTFSYGNETFRLDSLGYLHYANVSVGTPSSWFLVALDTGSDLFWLPCDCSSCVHGLGTSTGRRLELNIYSPNTSSTGENILCNNNLCSRKSRCPSAQSNCPYQVAYVSNGTSSTGVLVEDILHLITDDTQSKAVDAKIAFGCGRVQTGSFLDGAAPNGLFGLGMSNISVPSTLARDGHIYNSFSMCFGPDKLGRISFGDKGSSDQGETPFNLHQSHPTYNISITQINVEGDATDLAFSAIFDSGTSFTYLNDPAYAYISETFNNLANEARANITDFPFEYCYDISNNQMDLLIPTVNLIMKGGNHFNATDPIVIVDLGSGASAYCLGVVKSGDVNIIGQNFMTGYRVVFDHESNMLGWKPSDCYDAVDSSNLPIAPTGPWLPPATAVNPQATKGGDNSSPVSGVSTSSGNHAPQLDNLVHIMLILILIPFSAMF
uniref:Peptidase A1 domain-containing protein n=1 Tax=Rhizophora mucronata TaxID=61149 RepID=A0A2P2LG05_RHIMU